MLKSLKRLLGSKADGDDQEAVANAAVDSLFRDVVHAEELHGLRLDGRVKIDLLALNAHRPDMVFRWGRHDVYHHIAAIGHLDLGAGAHLCRFYLENDTVLQASVEHGKVVEFKLFDFFQVHHLADREFDALINGQQGSNELGAQVAELDAPDQGGTFRFTRVWGDPASRWSPPVEMAETVQSTETLVTRQVTHYGMLYERTVANSELMEYLLLAAEDDHDGGFMLVKNLGIDLSSVDIDAI